MDHPAVELRLPLDGGRSRLAVPVETTQFYLGVISAGTADEAPAPRETASGHRQFRALYDARDRISWSLSVDGESLHLPSDVWRRDGRAGIGWWRPIDPPALPATATVRFTTNGDAPTVDGEPIALWSPENTVVPWGATVESTLELVPSPRPPEDFPSRPDGMWQRHAVYEPLADVE